VDDDIEATEPLDAVLHQLRYAVALADIAPVEGRLAAGLRDTAHRLFAG
jgi:hypothetical protein